MRSVLAVLPLLLVGCGSSSSGDERKDAPINAVATTGMVADIVAHVAGERAEVTTLIGAGVDPHLYKVTRNDVARLMKADIVFYNGLKLEGKMADTLHRIARRKPVYPVTESLDAGTLIEPVGMSGHQDPHVWMDVSLWRKATGVIAAKLGDFDPRGARLYRENAERYGRQLEKLDQYVRKVIGTIPEERRVLVTAHDAFSYFGRAYDIQVEGIQGISTESEAGLKRINDLVDYLVEHKVSAVFVETSVADKNVRALVEGARSRGHELIVGGVLFSDAMGSAGTYQGTYIGMIDHNATTITRALGGVAPVAGMSGKLDDEANHP